MSKSPTPKLSLKSSLNKDSNNQKTNNNNTNSNTYNNDNNIYDYSDLSSFRSQSSLSSGASLEINDQTSLYTSCEPNFIIHTSRLRSRGIYEIEYIGNVRTGIILRNTIEHKFDDNSIHCVIDVKDIVEGDDENSVIISSNLRKIVDSGDILIKVNGRKVGKANLLEVSKWLQDSQKDNNMTRNLMFLKPDMVPLSSFLMFDNKNDSDYEVIYPPQQIIKCSRCKYHVEKQWKFCNTCGNNLTVSSSLSSSLSKKKKAKDFIEKINHDQYFNRSMYSSITINNNSNSKFNEYNDIYNDDNDDKVLNIDKTILKAIDERINSLNSDDYKKYKKKMILAEMLALELEFKNAEFVEESYRKIIEECKSVDDDLIADFI